MPRLGPPSLARSGAPSIVSLVCLVCLLFVWLSLAACGAAPAPTPAIAAPPPSSGAAGAADAGATATATPVEPNLEATKDRVIAAINAGDPPALFEMFGSHMKGTFPLPVLAQIIDGVRAGKGAISSAKRIHDDGDTRSAAYTATAERGEWHVELHLDDAGKIVGLAFSEPPAPPPPVKDSTIALKLPVRGSWLVSWGGDTAEQNHHLTNAEQRRAADLVSVEGGKHFKTDGKTNADYFAYGKDVLAMADGTVITVIDGVPENTPGETDPYFVYGNTVIVEHAGPVYSVYAHLQPGKVRVKIGAKVKQGAPLGVVGNSGNTTEPHLHVQLQDGPKLWGAWGVNAVFANVAVTRGGQATTATAYTFKKDDVLVIPAGAAK